MKLLHIDSSVLGPHSSPPGLRRHRRRLARRPPASTSSTATSPRPRWTLYGSTRRRSGRRAEPGLRRTSPPAKAMLDEFLAADIVVIGRRLYNFTIPKPLKAWTDRIVVARKKYSIAIRALRAGRRQAGDHRRLARHFYGAGAPAAGGRTPGD